ncbi:MAG TPA: 2-phospho-L-lactate guanylyltransferase [Candidatus Sulfotelmatobacter sp.]|nr:2-phospho-L-lactate guanylyltransferase [Candidatus Sulfotelmatobacter sp.]
MRGILIPVKEFHEAKKRLASHFGPADRAALAEAMCQDFFDVVAATRCADRVFVISKEPMALSRARKFGWETIVETTQISESDSVDAGSRHCADRGIEALLRLPIDLPLVEPTDIDAVFQHLDAAPSVVVVPSGDGTGTNALLRTPVMLFPSHFGPNSFPQHLAEAQKCGARTYVYRNSRLELDIDELEDLRKLGNRLKQGSATANWLMDHDLCSISAG